MRFNYGKIFLLGFGFFGISIIWGVYNAFVPVFLADKFHLDIRWIGFFMTLDNIAALFIQPTVGSWSDRLRTPIGRRMPFILVGAPIGAIAFGFIPLAAALPLFVVCTSTLLLSMAFWRTPAIALMPDITPSQFRSQANGIINLMGGVGAILSFLVGARLYELNKSYPFWMGSVLVIVAALLVFVFIKEPKAPAPSAQEPSIWRSLREVIDDEDKSALRVLLAIFFWFLGYTAIEALFTLYSINHLGISEANGARLMGDLSLIFVLFAIPAGYIGSRIGRRRTIIFGIILMSLVLIVLFILPPSTLLQPLVNLPLLGIVPAEGASSVLVVFGTMMMLAGAGWALININSLPMVVDMTDSAHLGTYTGLYYLFSTLSAIAGPIFFSFIVNLTGDNYNSMMIVAPIFMFVALLLMWGVRRGEAQKAEQPDQAVSALPALDT
jgi:maltose/moltooligosaccharide transporter